jgi:hypothetical protein
MVKLHASYGLKVPGAQEYSSESFHATAEVEVADSMANKPDALKAALNLLWADLKTAVAEQIRLRPAAPAKNNGRNGHSDGNGSTPGNGNGHHREPVNRIADNGNSPAASKKQIGFLLSLTRRKRNFSAEQTREWLRNERKLNLNALTKTDAATLIDELNVK